MKFTFNGEAYCIQPLVVRWYGGFYSMFALRMPFSCQEQSCLRSKRPNRISDYIVIHFVCAWCNHSVKNGVFTKDSHFYAPSKTIHSQVKYIIMDYFDQEAKKLDTWLVYSKVTGKSLCYSAALSSFVVGVSEWMVTKIHTDYREVSFSMSMKKYGQWHV